MPDESIRYAEKSAERQGPSLAGERGQSLHREDEELVHLAQQDDPVATEELMRRYQRNVYRIAYRMAYGDVEEAKDLTQEAFFRIFRNIKKFDGRSSFYTWLYRIAVNTCLGQRRKIHRWRKIFFRDRGSVQTPNDAENQPALDGESDPAVSCGTRQLREEVSKVLDSLPDKQRMVFHLKVMQEMTIPEIAAVTGMAEGTIKSHLFRATRKARDKLQVWLDE